MLTRIHGTNSTGPQNPEIPIGEAQFPVVFPHALEFNPPAHGTWNIVHIGMNVPEARQIYVCAINCMRGVILTAAEMGEQERFSFVILKEEDLVEGTVDDITLEGVTDLLNRLPGLPPAVILFPVCTHHFLGCDMDRIYRELGRRFPTVDFIHGLMDPIMQKEGLTPDQKLRIHMYDVLREQPKESGTIAILGGNVSLAQSSDLVQAASHFGKRLIQMPDCATYAEYLALGRAELFLGTVPNSRLAISKCAKRLGRKQLYLPMCFSYREIEQQLRLLAQELSIDEETWLGEYISRKQQACEEKLLALSRELEGVVIRIDYTAHPRPLGLARLLMEHGFAVDRMYLNAVSGEEKEDFEWLKGNAPELVLASTIWPECRVLPRTAAKEKPILAIGQQAAWFSGTDRFVNMVEGGDLQGFDGILRLVQWMQEAWATPKDTKDLIPRKGLGCRSCL